MGKDNYVTYARYLWGEMVPLPEAWECHSSGTNVLYRDRALAYWIEMSQCDPWTFDQLRDLLDSVMNSGETVPPALDCWAREFAAGRLRRPRLRGRKRVNRYEDAQIVLLVVFLVELLGKSRREACRILGEGLNKSPETIESAWRRYNKTV